MEGNPDFRDLFQCLNDGEARYLVVGAYAVIFHTEPRYTKDLGLWVEPEPGNASRVWNAIARFGAPVAELTTEDLCDPELVYQVGVEPNRFDILMAVKGLTFPEAWRNRVESTYADQPIHVLGLDDTIRAKKAAGRPQDLVDLKNLEARKRL
ncbi:MAG: hypothetical protein O7J95_14575 [Planctomycetota bacterium]|nr:hypothetical protein [Planctomycetota bacterium]